MGMVVVVRMTPDHPLLSCIDGCDAVIDVKRAINGFIVTNYLIRLLELLLHPLLYYCTTELNQHKENCITMQDKQCILIDVFWLLGTLLRCSLQTGAGKYFKYSQIVISRTSAG